MRPRSAVAKRCRLRCLQVTKDRSRARALRRAHHVAASIVLVGYAEDLALQLICGHSLALLGYDQAEIPYLLIGQVFVLVALAQKFLASARHLRSFTLLKTRNLSTPKSLEPIVIFYHGNGG